MTIAWICQGVLALPSRTIRNLAMHFDAVHMRLHKMERICPAICRCQPISGWWGGAQPPGV